MRTTLSDADLALPAGLFAHRYRLGRPLKHGNGVETMVATDTDSGTKVVLKIIDPAFVPPAARMRFEHETRVLRELTGLGIGTLHDAGTDGDRLYLAQPFITGRTLDAVLTRGPLDVAGTLRVGIDVASALDVAHGAGICHRDVKPANIIVRRTDPVGEAVLVDFGFARSAWLDESIRDDLVGTVRYLAPEAAGSLATPADERSDLYALGVVLYECLAGGPPFPGPTVSDLLRQHLSMSAPELRGIGVSVPRAVDAIIQRLLRKDPGERYQSAAALAADLSAILQALEAGDPDPRIAIGLLDRRRSLTDPSFVGREAEVDLLAGFAQGVSDGESGLVLVEADSGGGKSRLLREVAAQAAEAGVVVLHGQGVAQAGQRPFTLLHGVVDGLLALVEPDGAARAALAGQLRDVSAALVRAVPALAGIFGTAPAEDVGPEQFGELRSLAGFRRLLASLAGPGRPVLLILDDCQWADTLTVRLLAELFPPGHEPAYLGVIAAFRSEEVDTEHPLRRIDVGRYLSLGPLAPEAMSQLAESMAGPLPAEVIDIVVRLADGNPFMGAAVLRGMVESGALSTTADGWAVDETRLRDVQAARRSAAFLVRRLELLSADALRLLSIGAVLGKHFDIVTAVGVAGVSDDAAGIIADARRRRLLWVDERTGRCGFVHDKIREALLERLTTDERRELHARAAEQLLDRLSSGADASDEEIVFDLSYHLDAAGRFTEALHYALKAAELSRTRYALDAAAAHYRIAGRGVTEDDAATRVVVAEGLGDVLTLQGVYSEAEEQYVLARSLVQERAAAASIDAKLGALAFKQADIATARQHLEGALERLGRRIPRSTPAQVLFLLWEALVQAAHSIAPKLLLGRRSPAGREVDFLAMRIYSRLAYLYWFYSGRTTCAWTHLRGLNLAERYPPSPELAQAYSEHAPVMTMLPWFSRGLRYARRSYEIRHSYGDTWGKGQSLGFLAVVEYNASRFDDAIASCNEAIRLLRQTGDQWEVNTATWHLALCHWRKGELAEAAHVARELFYSAREIGDRTAAGIALSIWTRVSDGHLDGALLEEQIRASDGDDAQTTAELYLARALHARANGDLQAALDYLEQAAGVVRSAKLRQEYIAPIYPWIATVRRELSERAPLHNPRLRESFLRRAARSARVARRWARSYRNNAPQALRESALIASERGRCRRARRWMDASVAVAVAQGARYEAALSESIRAELCASWGVSSEVRPHDADSTAPDAVASISEDDEVPTISLFDRFSALLKAGRAITAAASYPALEAAIREAALALLRAERCHLVPLVALADERVTTQSGEDLYGMSRSLVQRAVEEGAPVVAVEQMADSQDSLLLSGIRSAIAAPIMVGGEPTTCLYATHRQVGRLFGDEEIQLASFIATLAGAALEHLAGSENRFRSLAQNSSDVITLVDRDGVVSYQSSAVKRVFAMAPTTLLGKPVTEWVHPDDLEAFRAALRSAGKADDTRIECRFRHADGSFRVAETTVTNLLQEPTVAALVLNTRDVTDRRRAEEQLREKNVELEKASRAKDMFLASMSHELRTPLNAIIGFTGTLLMELPGPLNSEQGRQLRTVQHSGKHLLAIINDLLDLAKIESGAVALNLEPVDAAQVVHRVLTTLQPLADAKSLPLVAELPGTPLIVRSDARALGQILINLVNNAIKFTEQGEVRVRLERTPAQGARVTVTDTGPGIEPDDLSRIFNAFERGPERKVIRSAEGTGLGLHISQKLVELIDADITVETTPGAGSTFTVVLPEEAAA